MRKTPAITCGLIMTTVLLAGLVSCTDSGTSGFDTPTAYDEETIAQYRTLINEGYAFLEDDELDSAVARFKSLSEVIPEAPYNEYHLACAYARNDMKTEALGLLQAAVDRGWDNPGQLASDPDFSSLADEPVFAQLQDKARANRDLNQAVFAERLPDYPLAQDTFATMEEFDAWAQAERGKIDMNSMVWFDAQYLAAKYDFMARRLANLRELKKDDPDFDYGLERVRTIGRVGSLYDCLGVTAESAAKEVDAYLAEGPEAEGASEANFIAGLVLSLRYCDGSETEAQRAEALNRSNEYLARVEQGTENYRAALTLTLANNLELAGDDWERYKPDIREVLTTHNDSVMVPRIVSTRFQPQAVSTLWPIPLDMQDIDGKMVALDDYEGKVLMIDFWATWCPPCRRELPFIREAYETYHDQGMEIVSISLDYEDRKPLEEYRTWIEENGMEWRHIYDGKGWGAELAGRYFVRSIPAPFLVGRDGELLTSGDDLHGENLAATIEAALAAQ